LTRVVSAQGEVDVATTAVLATAIGDAICCAPMRTATLQSRHEVWARCEVIAAGLNGVAPCSRPATIGTLAT